MIVKKIWRKWGKSGMEENRKTLWYCTGWFLFGVIPLYIIAVEEVQ